MSERTLRNHFHRFITRYKRLERQKRHLLKLYIDSQTMMQVHYANVVKMVNIMNLDVLENFNHSQEFLLNNAMQTKMGRMERFSRFWEYEVPAFSDEEFKTNFRMSRDSFERLCDKLQFLTKQDTNKQKAIPLRKRIAASLYALGTTQEYKTVAHLFGIGRSTIREIVLELALAICLKMYNEYVVGYPVTREKIDEIGMDFEQTFGIPQCYGVVGSCHVRIISPNRSEPDSTNSEGWHSVILFATADSKSQFTYINTEYLGYTTNWFIYENCLKPLYTANELFATTTRPIEDVKVPIFLVGDETFPLSKHLLTPYLSYDNDTRRTAMYNKVLSTCSHSLSTAFDDVRARFRKVGKGFDARSSNCAAIVKACCVLHNFLKFENDLVLESWTEEFLVREQSRGIRQPKCESLMDQNDRPGRAVRNALATYFENTFAVNGSSD